MIEAGVLEGCEGESDASRLARLFDAHHERLYRLARRLSANCEEAQDLVQEAFVRAAAAGRRMPAAPDGEEAWLVRVLINLSRDRWRRQKVRLSGRREAASEDSSAPEATYIARLLVQRALATLPPRRRAIVVLHEMEGIDTAGVARLLGISAVTVRWHLSRARAELARALSGRPAGSAPDDHEA